MPSIVVTAGADRQLEEFLAERLYEYNAEVTGAHDGEAFTAACRDPAGAVEAAASGYTWGGCCFISQVWVAQASRGRGLGSGLIAAVERHARHRGCQVVLVSSHSFQAPGFYAGRGYEQVARVDDHPVGHANLFFCKRLTAP